MITATKFVAVLQPILVIASNLNKSTILIIHKITIPVIALENTTENMYRKLQTAYLFDIKQPVEVPKEVRSRKVARAHGRHLKCVVTCTRHSRFQNLASDQFGQ